MSICFCLNMAKSATVVAELRSTASVNKQGTKKSSASKKGSAKKPKKRTKKRSIFNIKRNILDMLQTRDDGIVTISKGAMTELHNMVFFYFLDHMFLSFK